MSTTWRPLRRTAVAALAALTLVAGSVTAYADNTIPDGDNTKPVAAIALSLGDVCAGTAKGADVLVAVSRNGNVNNVFLAGTTVTVAVSGTTGTGLSAAMGSPNTLTIPLNWATAANNTMSPAVTSTVTLNTGTTGAFTGTVTYSSTGKEATTGNPTISRTGTLNVTANVVNCNTPPSITVNDVTLEGDTLGGRTLSFADIGTASDAEDAPALPAVTCIPAIGSVLPLGTTTVNCTATDSDDLTSSDSGDVTVEDTTDPAISGTPASATVEATSADGAAFSFATPTATDIVWGSVSVDCAPASGSTFALGPNTVICTATDGSANSATSTFQVNVQDTTDPAFTQPADITKEATSPDGAVVTFSNPVATDAVDVSIASTCIPVSGSTFALGATTVTCSATDEAGNTGDTSFVVHVVDTTAPDLTVPADITEEATSAAGAPVTFTATATDAVDGVPVVTCTPASGSTFPLGTTTVTCTATDFSGNTSDEESFTVTVEDTTAPTLAGMPEDATVEGNTAGGALWAYTAPTATDLVDPNPSVECVPGESSFYVLGATTVTCTATDSHGNEASDSFTVTVVDTTDPVITWVSTTPAPNTNGWNNTAVTVEWSCTDIVGILDETLTTTLNDEGADQSAIGTCEDTSGNTASDTQSGINIDLTAPLISVTVTPDLPGSGWWNEVSGAPTATFTCSDSTSGIDACPDAVTFGEGEDQATTGIVLDKAGNSASAGVSNIDVDLTDPGITWNGGPSDGSDHYFGSVPAGPTCTADDALSGAKDCAVTGYATTVGSHTMTATAHDNADNEATDTRSYSVLAWTLKGFYQPVDMNAVNTVKSGSTVPLKFEVFAGASELTDVAVVNSFKVGVVACTNFAGDPTDDIEQYTSGATVLRYDTTGGQFIQNWQTPKGKAGTCYKVTMTTDDGTSLSANFKLK